MRPADAVTDLGQISNVGGDHLLLRGVLVGRVWHI